MKQLSALDTTFLSLETATTPMHVGCVAIYDPATMAKGQLDFAAFMSHFEQRLPRIPLLRQRHVCAPLGLDYPYWISDPDFRLDYHIRHIALPRPGNWQQLCTQVARLHARPLDLNHAPWELYVISGLDSIETMPAGCFALVSKMHHALIDGVRGAQLLAALHDLTLRPGPAPSPSTVIVDRVPTPVELLTRAALNMPGNLMARVKATTRQGMPLLRDMAGRLLSGGSRGILPPRTRFNGKVSPHRVFDAVSFDLNEIKALRKPVSGSTVNDVMMTIVSGALRHYLASKGELPATTLNALVPMNTMAAPTNTQGNHISFMFPAIHTDTADPVERLAAIHQDNNASKARQQKHDGQLLMDSSRLLPTTVTHLLIDRAIRYNLANRMKPLFNTVITNIPGPQLPLYHGGAKMLAFHGAGICYDTVGLFHIIFSYNGQISISFTSCQDMMPDPGRYASCLKKAQAEMARALAASAQPA